MAENKQLTAQEAALYYGQQCLCTAIGDNQRVIQVGEAVLNDLKNGYPYKLLLRPLADITEEEAQRVTALYYEAPVYNFSFKKGIATGYIHQGDTTEDIELDFYYKYFNAPAFQYLLSRGFDLFGFIEQGKALDKTKQQLI